MTDRRRHKVATVEDFEEDGDRVIEDVEGLEIAVFRVDGDYHGLANFCPHQSGPLCEGKLMGAISGIDGWRLEYDEDDLNIACPWHSWRFDIETGANLETDRYAVPTYDVEVEDGDVYVLR
jgi:nitrite reductase/ring-hydroxylating ferredoxin subunit